MAVLECTCWVFWGHWVKRRKFCWVSFMAAKLLRKGLHPHPIFRSTSPLCFTHPLIIKFFQPRIIQYFEISIPPICNRGRGRGTVQTMILYIYIYTTYISIIFRDSTKLKMVWIKITTFLKRRISIILWSFSSYLLSTNWAIFIYHNNCLGHMLIT